MTHDQLAAKYRRMLELRRTLSGPPDAGTRARLKQLAREFPGALRELDTLPTEEMERRLLALEAGGDEPWMRWLSRFHTLMSAALRIRAGGHEIDEAFVAAVKAPAHGRLMVVVFDRMSAEEGVDRATIWDTLFPPRKGPREYRRT